jgi:predicted aspartyl protease
VGITYLKLQIANPRQPRRAESLELLVDTGAVYSVVHGRVLRRLGIKPDRTKEFTPADGSHARRRIGGAVLQVDGRRGPSPVIFGEKDDAALLGAVTLEALGLMIDPLKRPLRPLPMLLV